MTKTIIIRIPVEPDGREITAIAKKWNVRMGAAYQIWKKKNNINFKWKEC